ncbi:MULTISPECIES: helix-turn-helix domain-containing protein [unclassified Micromonospora]|uniref:AraC-like ligand-binding domain-containing protein n=1 Tax=unclassified Micromonospora TaxID=2617518 RepID=UPI003330AC75
MLAVDAVDTAALPEGDRFGFWHDLVARESVPARIHSAHARDFRAGATVVGLGDVVLSSWRYPSLEMQRTERFIRRGDPEMYQLALPLTGHGSVEQERRENALLPGHFAFVDTSRPHASSHQARAPRENMLTTLTVLVPHSMIPLRRNEITKLLGASIPASQGMGALLRQFVQQVVNHPEQYEEGDAPRLGLVARDLVAATAAHRLTVADALPHDVQHHALRIRIRAFIERNLHEPDLSPAAVAAAHHISLRTLHRLFQSEDTTVADLIRTKRLDRCARDLSDRMLRGRPIYAIAARWGFSDKAHFSRAFRAAYGVSPQAYRSR